MKRVGIHQARMRLSELVKRAEEGEEVVIRRRGKAVARLMPVGEENGGIASAFGVWRGKVQIADDFDELPDAGPEAFGIR